MRPVLCSAKKVKDQQTGTTTHLSSLIYVQTSEETIKWGKSRCFMYCTI